MSISLSPNLPSNVVEIGVEIAQAKLDAINNGSSPTSGNPFTTVSYVTGLGYLTSATANAAYATIASPTFTGTVTIPAGASISGYLTTSSASSTYQTQAGMTSYAPKASPTFTGTVTIPAGASIVGYATQTYVSNLFQPLSGMSSYLTTSAASSTYQPIGSYLTDAPNNGSEYVRKNAAWAVATGGGGATAASQLTNAVYATNPTAAPTTAGDVLSFNGTALVWAAAGGGGGLTISTLSNAATSTLNATAPTTGQSLTYNGTDLIWATVGGGGGISDAPADGVIYARKDSAWYSISGYATETWVNQNFLPRKTVQSCPTTFGAGDQNKINHFVPAMGGSTITIPADSTYAFPNGTEIVIVSDYSAGGTSQISGQYAGQPTINGLSSVTMSANVSKLVKIATDVWFYT